MEIKSVAFRESRIDKIVLIAWRRGQLKHSFSKACCLVLYTLIFASLCSAERGVLVVHVSDIHNQAVPGVELSTKGPSESDTTDRFGRALIKVNPATKVNSWIVLQIIRSPKGKDLVFISPSDGSTPPTGSLPSLLQGNSDCCSAEMVQSMELSAPLPASNGAEGKIHMGQKLSNAARFMTTS